MSFVPHTKTDIKAMLQAIGVEDLQALFAEIPDNLKITNELQVPAALNELEVSQLMSERAKLDAGYQSYLGAGAYEHHIPAAVWELVSRGEFYTAYTPYQAEASQGGLQLIYEYQTMMASLTGLEVSNASLYDGANALAEAILMAVRANKKSKSNKVLVLGSLHPFYKTTAQTVTSLQNIELVEVPIDFESGRVELAKLAQYTNEAAALVIQQPNFFGCLETVDELTDWAHQQGLLVIAVVNPTSLALLKEPGRWGQLGADIACGEGQPLGVPLSSGGPYFGFLTCKKVLIREMPGRIVGRTVDQEGKQGFTLTLQAREQHIRRAKAKSNVCTNQGLLVVAATIYMSLLGPEGLKRVALASHHQTKQLVEGLLKLPGVKQAFQAPFFHEVVMKFEKPVAEILSYCQTEGILAGVNLNVLKPECGNALLICVTETKTMADIEHYIQVMKHALSDHSQRSKIVENGLGAKV